MGPIDRFLRRGDDPTNVNWRPFQASISTQNFKPPLVAKKKHIEVVLGHAFWQKFAENSMILLAQNLFFTYQLSRYQVTAQVRISKGKSQCVVREGYWQWDPQWRRSAVTAPAIPNRLHLRLTGFIQWLHQSGAPPPDNTEGFWVLGPKWNQGGYSSEIRNVFGKQKIIFCKFTFPAQLIIHNTQHWKHRKQKLFTKILEKVRTSSATNAPFSQVRVVEHLKS